MSDWTRVVTDPLGIAGFALFLVFGLLARLKAGRERRWLSRASIILASVALLGGLSLAYIRLTREMATAGKSQVPQQSTSSPPTKGGPGQPITVTGNDNAVVGVSNVETKGNLTINADQGSDSTQTKKAQTEKTSQRKKP